MERVASPAPPLGCEERMGVHGEDFTEWQSDEVVKFEEFDKFLIGGLQNFFQS